MEIGAVGLKTYDTRPISGVEGLSFTPIQATHYVSCFYRSPLLFSIPKTAKDMRHAANHLAYRVDDRDNPTLSIDMISNAPLLIACCALLPQSWHVGTINLYPGSRPSKAMTVGPYGSRYTGATRRYICAPVEFG
jgi:hypothetical protein